MLKRFFTPMVDRAENVELAPPTPQVYTLEELKKMAESFPTPKPSFTERLEKCNEFNYPSIFLDPLYYTLLDVPLILNKREQYTLNKNTIFLLPRASHPYTNEPIASLTLNTKMVDNIEEYVRQIECLNQAETAVASAKTPYQLYKKRLLLRDALVNFIEYCRNLICTSNMDETEKKSDLKEIVEPKETTLKHLNILLENSFYSSLSAFSQDIKSANQLENEINEQQKNLNFIITNLQQEGYAEEALRIFIENNMLEMKSKKYEVITLLDKLIVETDLYLQEGIKDQDQAAISTFTQIKKSLQEKLNTLHKELAELFPADTNINSTEKVLNLLKQKPSSVQQIILTHSTLFNTNNHRTEVPIPTQIVTSPRLGANYNDLD